MSIRTLLRPIRQIIRPDDSRRRRALWALNDGLVGAEIGVWQGDFSQSILNYSKPRKLHLIDPWLVIDDSDYGDWLVGRTQEELDAIFEAVTTRFQEPIRRGQVQIHRARSLDAVTHFADQSLDWVYIDGDHRYPGIKADLEAYFTKVKRGGLIIGDDYSDPGWWEDGVRKAVDEFVQSGRVKFLWEEDCQFALRKC